jgi:hypothetical protein
LKTQRKSELKVQGNLVKGSFRIRKDNSYIIVLNDLSDNNNLQPVRYYVKALYDSNPAIELVYPKQDVSLANDSRVPIEVKVNDDYGFSKLILIINSLHQDMNLFKKNFHRLKFL